jgi:prepilin-type processing-associated H-X9-DG protein
VHLLPFLENAASYQAINLDVPLFGVDFQVSPENREAVSIRIAEFLCPSDRQDAENRSFGPTNYAACTGTGAGGGTPFAADGLFYINSATRFAEIADGLSNTVTFSESILGRTPPLMTPRDEADARLVYGFARAVPLTEAACEGTALWNFTQSRGFSWANGEYRSALYNHYWLPNASQFDCVSAVISGDLSQVHSGYGWKTARSWHSGGVNAAFADGSLRFLANEVDPAIWRAMATRDAGEPTP